MLFFLYRKKTGFRVRSFGRGVLGVFRSVAGKSGVIRIVQGDKTREVWHNDREPLAGRKNLLSKKR